MKHRKSFLRHATAVLALLVIAAAGAALAHTKEETTVPADGAFLQTPPEAVLMTFDAPIRITAIRLTGETGGTFELERSDGMEPVTDFRAVPPLLPADRYTVDWRGLSSDGHLVTGSFSFEIAP